MMESFFFTGSFYLVALGYFMGNYAYQWMASFEKLLCNSQFKKASALCLLLLALKKKDTGEDPYKLFVKI